MQFYAGNFIENEKGKNGHVYGKRHGFCLETQVEPNAVNVEGFHSPVLEAGEKYHSCDSLPFLHKNNVFIFPVFLIKYSMRKTGFFCLVFVQAGLLLTAKEAERKNKRYACFLWIRITGRTATKKP